MKHASWLLLLPLLFSAVPPVQADEAVKFSLPPESLGKWYKPQNKRQVWLHTMFGLRRSMQAVSEYAALEDPARLQKWATRFVKAYTKLPQMVPEWQDEVELKWAERLQAAAEQGDFGGVATALRKVGVSCGSCHNEYQAQVRALFRSPDFHEVKVEYAETLDEVPYPKVMEQLSTYLNRIKIAMEDGRQSAARQAAQNLETRLQDLGGNCASCHRDDPAPHERILGDPTRLRLEKLMAGIEEGDQKGTGRLLGEIGVNVCARCHSVHRTLSDLRHRLAKHAH